VAAYTVFPNLGVRVKPYLIRKVVDQNNHVLEENYPDRKHVIDKETGKILSSFDFGYACTRFTFSEPYVMGANMDMIDLSQDGKLVSTGPAIDSRECLGAVVSNGRIFYMSQASGFIVSQTYGEESKNLPAVWERP
jgi:membrane carboxypeptidase/penicillin-binding protein